MNLEDLDKKIKKNANKINSNLEKIEKNSYALEIMSDYKNESKRLFIILIIVLVFWFLTIGYLVYVLNDTGTIEETKTTQEISEVDNIENTNIVNGDMYGKDKTN